MANEYFNKGRDFMDRVTIPNLKGEYYIHYKNNKLYHVVDQSICSNNAEGQNGVQMVDYVDTTDGQRYTRTLDEFMERLRVLDGPDPVDVPRFRHVDRTNARHPLHDPKVDRPFSDAEKRDARDRATAVARKHLANAAGVKQAPRPVHPEYEARPNLGELSFDSHPMHRNDPVAELVPPSPLVNGVDPDPDYPVRPRETGYQAIALERMQQASDAQRKVDPTTESIERGNAERAALAHDTVVIYNVDQLTDQQALGQFCKELERVRGQQNKDESLSRSLPKAIVDWLVRYTTRLKRHDIDYAEITFRIHASEQFFDDDEHECYTVRIEEKSCSDDIEGPVPK